MKYAIHITDMTAGELATVAAFLESIGASPATANGPKGRQTIAELAAATGATPAQPTSPTPPAAADPFAAPAATPAPPPGIPASRDPGTPQVTAAGEIDSKGFPHNPEFHADSKRKNADGSWAKRKGVNKDACAAWEASFTAGQSPAPAPTAAPASVVPTAEQINAMHGVTTPPNGHTVVTAPPASTVPAADPFAAPSAPPAPPAPVAEKKRVTYAEWYGLYSNLLSAGKISPEKYSEIAARYGALDNAMVFMQNDDARANCYAEFEALAAA